MFTTWDKAIAAFLTAIVSVLVMLNVPLPSFLTDPTTQATIVSILTGIVTYLVPNKPKPAA